jgi:Colicin V production protein
MVWIIAFLCLGLVGAAGYYQGPVRAAFSFFGLVFGTLLAGPLSPLTKHLLPLVGLHHPAWNIFAPQVLAFLIVLIIFKIAGQVVHQKIAVHFKYKVSEQLLYRWQRIYARLGACVGLLNGAVYFILLTLLIYSAGYFTTEAATGQGDPMGARFLTETRKELHGQNMDRVLASYDMVPGKVYKAADLTALILHNPLLLSRLGHYPPCLQLAEQKAFKNLAHDVQLQQMIATQAKVIDILRYPSVQAMLTNSTIVAQVSGLIGNDLDDLQTFLTTGQSPKYDPETILGIWDIDRAATVAQVRKKQPAITPKQLGKIEADLFPLIAGLSLTATPDNQMILKQPNPNTSESTIVAAGTWKKDQDTYQVNLPGSLPETSEIEIEEGNRLFLPKFGYVLAFDKEL